LSAVWLLVLHRSVGPILASCRAGFSARTPWLSGKDASGFSHPTDRPLHPTDLSLTDAYLVPPKKAVLVMQKMKILANFLEWDKHINAKPDPVLPKILRKAS